ncbi:TPA: hypothetical protein ACNH1V_000481 [Citrobacter koseri]
MTDKQALRTDLLIVNALETAKQLRELQESPVAEAIFESIVENENGKEIQFERPISDLAYAAFLKIERLVEALESAKQRNAELVHNHCVHAARLIDERGQLKQRIAELESRTVTLEPFRSFVTDADIAALHRFAECCDDPESGGHDLEKEQVRRLEAIGALQRSGRISYITGFGDVLISITSGIGKGE